jgi:hypothetical protein
MLSETKITDRVLETLKKNFKPLSLWSSRFTANRVASVRVPLIDAVTEGAAFAGSLITGVENPDNTGPVVTLDRYYKTLSITGKQNDDSMANELSNYIGKATEGLITKLNSVINAKLVASNFAVALTSSVANFDSADIKALRAVAGALEWGEKNIVLHPDVYANVIPADRNALPLYEFTALEGKHVPAELLGYICNPTGLAIASSMPTWKGAFVRQQVVTDADTGFTVRVTFWEDVVTQQEYLTVDTGFGVEVGLDTGVRLIARA